MESELPLTKLAGLGDEKAGPCDVLEIVGKYPKSVPLHISWGCVEVREERKVIVRKRHKIYTITDSA